ncbi:roadblock/LC7 domain-containing protein [Streptomyces sp. NPDC014764]|uniref:roadblock/LC7 domain-containing protein n=1 Tax=Streptomyces sp. NPDC014764 TaxID=3364907 RepID=UPI0036FE9BBF
MRPSAGRPPTPRPGSVRHALFGQHLVDPHPDQQLARHAAEHLAAVSSGLHSLAKGSGRHFGAGGVRQTMVEFDEAVLFVTAAGSGSCLCVLSGAETDIGHIAYEMTLLVNRVGEHLDVDTRRRPDPDADV